jgi:hypothetical protein
MQAEAVPTNAAWNILSAKPHFLKLGNFARRQGSLLLGEVNYWTPKNKCAGI